MPHKVPNTVRVTLAISPVFGSMKSLLFSASLILSIKLANAAPRTNGGSSGNFATDSPCPVIQGANLLGCLLKSDCLSNGPGGAYIESNVCKGPNNCCYNYIPCTISRGDFCLNNGETSCIGGQWKQGCPAGANGNLQCCIIPDVSSFHSTNEQANFEYFKSASVLELSFPPPQASILEQQQPSEERGSANALNSLDQYFEDGQFPVGDDGSSLNSPAQPITENNLVSYYGAPVAGPDPWAEALGQSFE